MVSDSSLSVFIASNPDARELKRALAVQRTLLGLKQGAIQAILGVQSSFISTWKKRYLSEGVECFRLAYKGSSPYLSADQRGQINAWLSTQSQAFGRRVSFLYPNAVWRRVSLLAKLLRPAFSGRL